MYKYLSLEDDKNSTAESIARLLTQSVCPVNVLWHVPAFHIFMVLSAEPGKEKQICSQNLNLLPFIREHLSRNLFCLTLQSFLFRLPKGDFTYYIGQENFFVKKNRLMHLLPCEQWLLYIDDTKVCQAVVLLWCIQCTCKHQAMLWHHLNSPNGSFMTLKFHHTFASYPHTCCSVK